MGRPKKQTVDYFPHMVAHKRTMFVIEGKWGNDGYAFWFKLLEILGSTDGHYFDCNSRENWEFLQAKTRFNDCKAREILDTLSGLNAVDAELWEHGIIWSQNFVDGITPVYDNRKTKPPTRPKIISTPNLQEKTPFLLEPLSPQKIETHITNTSNPNNYSKKQGSYALEYSRVEETRLEETRGKRDHHHQDSNNMSAGSKPAADVPVPDVDSTPADDDLLKTTKLKKDQQLADLADLLREENPVEYKKLLEKHPELIPETIPWEAKSER